VPESVPGWTLVPFPLLLLSIALLPLALPEWWESNRHKGLVAGALAAPVVLHFVLAGEAGRHALDHGARDYVSFVLLIGSLFVIAGGIHVGGSLAGTPLSNTAMLAIGAVLANAIGTTGAAMVLIRPVLRANERRRRRSHIVVFFIFVVANCGGLLTPLGDPPLFLGFLHGVPFLWTLSLWGPWLAVNGLLLVVFNRVDQRIFEHEEREFPEPLLEEVLEHAPLQVEGKRNLAFLAGVVLVMVGRGSGWGTGGEPWPFGIQEAGLAGLAALSWVATPARVRTANRFTFHPILEVATIFAGIFLTMLPPLIILNARGTEIGIDRAWEYFWTTGALSSFLDNAPTYLTFAATAAGRFGVSIDDPQYLAHLLDAGPEAARALAAISCGAVMMGAMTYIGNGPNFMVKAIAERDGVEMPSFLGYMRWSAVVLLPILLVVTLLFFRD
jgi:Na+/H+ antiporter NhaD/arsenite permease-like protein